MGKHRYGVASRPVVEYARGLCARAEAVSAAVELLRARAREDVADCTAEHVDAELEALPIEALRPFARGVRLSVLEDAGLTVADVVAGGAALRSLDGLGPSQVRTVVAAGERLATDVEDRARVRFDPDRRPPEHTDLLAVLAALRDAERASRGCAELVREVSPLVEDAQPGGFAMRFSRPRRDAAEAALFRLRTLLIRPDVVELRETLDHARVFPEDWQPGELWRAYLDDAASFNATLATLAGYDADSEAAHGFVSDDFSEQVSRVPLDTTLLNATLRQYQVFGAQYVIAQRRVIIGDEMGLGKTVESLAVLTHLAAKGYSRFLVVCPASVQFNWLKEIAKHTQLAGYRLHGSQRDQECARWLETGGVAVTTFNTLARLGLEDTPVDMLIVDEAHYVKNPAARRTDAVRSVADDAERVLFLTGTPLENRLSEFRNLVRYLQPEVAAKIAADESPVTSAREFRQLVAPVYLRRNQEDVLTELPEKIEVEDWILMSEGDRALYQAAVEAGNMMQMRQAAMRGTDSAKLERLKQIVAEAREENRKVIIFSYFLRVLEAVADALGPVTVGPLTGSVTPGQRQQLVDDFSARPGHAVLLSQVEAGGVGLNVQAASVVILVEPQWKPSTEQQAIARAHRMGQVHTVLVHRLLAKDSVDERLREIQEGKTELFDQYARPSNAKDADPRAVATGAAMEQRIIAAEKRRLDVH